jgi:hypothetical protein
LEPLNNSAQKGLMKAKHAITKERLKAKAASPSYFLETSPN